MSVWQIAMTIIATFYGLAILYVIFSTARVWGQVDLDRPAAQYCPEGSRCRLCSGARATTAGEPGSRASIGEPTS